MPVKTIWVEQQLYVYFIAQKGDRLIIKFMANRLAHEFGESAYGIVGAFEIKGWTLDELYQLDNTSHEWRKDPLRVLQLQESLASVGCDPASARRIASEPILYAADEPQRVIDAVKEYMACGLTPDQLRMLTGRRADALLQAPVDIRAWSDSLAANGKSRLDFIRHLPRLGKQKRRIAALPAQVNWMLTAIPHDREPEVLRPKKKATPSPLPEALPPTEPVGYTTDLSGFKFETERPQPVPVEPPPAVAPETPPSAPVVSAPVKIEPLKPLKVFKPFIPRKPDPERPKDRPNRTTPPRVTAEELEDVESVKDVMELASTILSKHDPKWFEENGDKFHAANPWLADESAPAWLVFKLLKSWSGLNPKIPTQDDCPLLAFLACFLRNDNLQARHSLRLLLIQRAALKHQGDSSAEAKLQSLEIRIAETRDLIDPSASVAAMRQELERLSEQARCTDDSKAAQKKIRAAELAISALQERIARKLHYADLGSFLRLSPEIAFLRLYASRRILGYDGPDTHKAFLAHPEFLLHPFERIHGGNGLAVRGLSIPPPASADNEPLDEKTVIQLQAIGQELRFRVNELQRFTDKPWKRPYISMLLEPQRERFQKRLDAWRKRNKAGFDSPRWNKTRRQATPFSPMS